MTITNPGSAAAAIEREAAEIARQMLSTISLAAVAPEKYAGTLYCQERLLVLARTAYDRAPAEAAAITGSAWADLEALRRDELRANPFRNDCFAQASRSVLGLPRPLDADGIRAAITGPIGKSLEDACQDVDRHAARKLKTQRVADQRRRRLRAEIDAYLYKSAPVLAGHICGLVRDQAADEVTRRYEAAGRSLAALRRRCQEAADPGDNIAGSHRFSCGPRLSVVLKATAAKRPDLLDRDGRPTEAIWAAFGAEVADGDLACTEDPQESIAALQRFLESTVADALDGLTLDSLYELSGEPPEAPSWIGRSAARLQAASHEEPYRVRLAQVPASTSDALYDQILHHIQTAARSEEDNRLQLVEFTYAFRADEILRADRRGLARVLTAILPHVSNPQLAKAIGAQLADLTPRGGHGAEHARENGHPAQGTRPVTS
jgi:hypothetical protein